MSPRIRLVFPALVLACNPPGSDDGSSATSDDATSDATDPTTDGDYVVVPCPKYNTGMSSNDDMLTMGVYTQDELDMLAGCTDLDISLRISSEDPLDLSPLSELRHIVGDFSIYGHSCPGQGQGQDRGPPALTGLEKLESVRDLRLECLRIPDVAPLAGLTTVGRDLSISSLHAISSLEGLHNLTGVRESLVVSDCDQLVDLAGLRGLQTAGIRVALYGLPITDLHGLESLVQVGGPDRESRVTLSNLRALTSLDGLTVEWGAEHDVFIHGTAITDLTSFTGVDELTALDLGDNDALTDLTGLEDLAVVRGELRLGGNNGLTDLSALVALESLGALTLEATAFTELGPLPALVDPGAVRLSDNAQLTALPALAGSTRLRGLIVERNAALTGLPELVELATVDGALELRDNPGLIDLSDLPAVTTVGGRLAVVYHTNLLQTDAEAWAAPITAADRKIVANVGYDAPILDPCPWADDGECDHDVRDPASDGSDCLSD